MSSADALAQVRRGRGQELLDGMKQKLTPCSSSLSLFSECFVNARTGVKEPCHAAVRSDDGEL